MGQEHVGRDRIIVGEYNRALALVVAIDSAGVLKLANGIWTLEWFAIIWLVVFWITIEEDIVRRSFAHATCRVSLPEFVRILQLKKTPYLYTVRSRLVQVPFIPSPCPLAQHRQPVSPFQPYHPIASVKCRPQPKPCRGAFSLCSPPNQRLLERALDHTVAGILSFASQPWLKSHLLHI